MVETIRRWWKTLITVASGSIAALLLTQTIPVTPEIAKIFNEIAKFVGISGTENNAFLEAALTPIIIASGGLFFELALRLSFIARRITRSFIGY
jgi:hypothetical protein